MLIQAYRDTWAQDFEAIQEVLQLALKDLDVRIEHIGSTSVPGLAAKSIIDIDIIYPSSDHFLTIVSSLSKIGYAHKGDQGIPGREVFKRKLSSTNHTVLDDIRHHLYACTIDSEELKRHLLFRDYLRKHSSARKAYQKLKYQIAEMANQDRKVYAHLKQNMARDFVLSILQAAEQENTV